MDLLDKLRAVADRAASFETATRPADTQIDEILGPGEVLIQDRPTLMFGSNNYLGLTCHPAVIAASKAALDRYGSGTTGSRVANGTLGIHRELERDIARRFGKREALIFTTGYQTNLSLLSGLCGPDDDILIDADSHASIHDAARLTASAPSTPSSTSSCSTSSIPGASSFSTHETRIAGCAAGCASTMCGSGSGSAGPPIPRGLLSILTLSLLGAADRFPSPQRRRWDRSRPRCRTNQVRTLFQDPTAREGDAPPNVELRMKQ